MSTQYISRTVPLSYRGYATCDRCAETSEENPLESINYGIIRVPKGPAMLATSEAVAPERWRFMMHHKSTPDNNSIPHGYCHCGCGQRTNLSPRNDYRRGNKKGEPVKYVAGHFARINTGPRKDRPIPIPIDAYTVAIPLVGVRGEGLIALVNACDLEVVASRRWWVDKNGYVFSHRPGDRLVSESLHRLVTGVPVGEEIDHENHNTLDNRRSNLRVCTRAENTRNTRGWRSSSSIYKGVSWDASRQGWCAHIRVDGRDRNLGRFDDEREAAIAYDNAALENYGQFAFVNFPEMQEVVQ